MPATKEDRQAARMLSAIHGTLGRSGKPMQPVKCPKCWRKFYTLMESGVCLACEVGRK